MHIKTNLVLFAIAEWLPEDDVEEVIRCICGIYKDEGLMIQCEKCYVSTEGRRYLGCTFFLMFSKVTYHL